MVHRQHRCEWGITPIVAALVWLLVSSLMSSAAWCGELTLHLEVDARDLPRRLLHTRMRIPCNPGPLTLWYPKWIPGTHAPSGPLDTVGGLRLTTPDGQAIAWHRDEVELYRLTCQMPAGTHEVQVELDTICNAPAVEASGHLSYGNALVGIINWPTCLLYPDGATADETQIALALRLAADLEARHGPEVER